MKIKNFDTYLSPTIVSANLAHTKFHPGIKHGLSIYYWPNRTFDSKDAAIKAAELAVNDALEAANSVIATRHDGG